MKLSTLSKEKEAKNRYARFFFYKGSGKVLESSDVIQIDGVWILWKSLGRLSLKAPLLVYLAAELQQIKE